MTINTNVLIPTAQFVGVANNMLVVASKDKARPILGCVRVDVDHEERTAKFTTTDSYMLVEETLSDVAADYSFSVLIGRDVLTEASKNAKAKKGFGFVKIFDGMESCPSIIDVTEETQFKVPFVDVDSYPGVTALWPDPDVEYTPISDVAFGVGILANISKLRPVNGTHGSTGQFAAFKFSLKAKSSTSPILFESGSLRGLIMPVRTT